MANHNSTTPAERMAYHAGQSAAFHERADRLRREIAAFLQEQARKRQGGAQ